MRVLPGPPELTRQQLEAVYDRCVLDDHHDAEGTDDAVTPTEQDFDWLAWCAEQVAASSPLAVDDAVAAAAEQYWRAQQAAAAERGRDRAAAEDVAWAAARAQDTATAAFTTWLADADEATLAQVSAAAAERAAIRQAAEHRDQVVSLQRAIGAAQVAQLRVLAAMAPIYRGTPNPHVMDPADPGDLGGSAPPSGAVGMKNLIAEISTTLKWTGYTTSKRLDMAERMTAVLTATSARLDAGELDLTRATIVAERTAFTSPLVAARVDEELFGDDGCGLGLTSAQLRAMVDAVLGRLDAAAVRRRSRAKVADRGVTVVPLGDGISRMEITGPTPAVAAAHERLCDVARANHDEARRAAARGQVAADGGDPYAVPGVDVADPARAGDLDAPLADRRGVRAHRFDAAITAVGLARPADPVSARPSPGLEMHTSLPGLVGQNEDPGLLEGYGWVPAWLVRQGLQWKGCRIRRMLTDPYTGDLITVDGHTYPASWLTDPDAGAGGPGPGPGGGSGPGPDPGGPRSGPGFFKGLPVQRLPPPRTEDDVLSPPLPEPPDTADAAAAATPWVDPCVRGTCSPVDPAACPARDSTGRAVGRHDPPAALERFVRRLWGRCTGPGATTGASRCDVDHGIAWREDGSGGTTCSCNLDPKSRFWHGLKHATDPATWTNPTTADDIASVSWSARWQQWRCTDGSVHWRSPLGTDHHTKPRQVTQPVGRFRPTPWPMSTAWHRHRAPADHDPTLPPLTYPDDDRLDERTETHAAPAY